MPRFYILRSCRRCGMVRNVFVRENLIICCVVDCVSYFFGYASLCLLWTFPSEWSKCMRWGSVIVMGSDMLFEIFQSTNVEIVYAVDYFNCYCCCRYWSLGIEYSLQCPCSRRTRTLSNRRLSVIPVLEWFFLLGTVVGVTAMVHSRKTPTMVCEQTWCFVQCVYLHIRHLLLMIHLLIGGFSMLVFEYLLYLIHGMTKVWAFVSLAFFFLKKLEKLCLKIMLCWCRTFWTYCATNANVPSLPFDQLIHFLRWLTHVFYF